MKKLVATLFIMLLGVQTFAAPCQVAQCQEHVLCEQHMFPEKNAPCSKVIITNLRNILCKGNVFTIVFDCKFWSDKQKAGDRVNFSVPEAIYTQEGTLLIPACSKLVATVIKIEKQRKFNKNARVYLKFECLVLPDGTAIAMSLMGSTACSRSCRLLRL